MVTSGAKTAILNEDRMRYPAMRRPDGQVSRRSRAAALGGMAILIGLSSAANAADAVIQQDVQPSFDPIEERSLWEGVYGGLYGGVQMKSVGVMGSGDDDLPHVPEGGAYVGFNTDFGNSIIGGLEGLVGLSKTEAEVGGIDIKQDVETSLRARMGYAFEQNLVYGLAGVNASQVTASAGGGEDTNWLTGWSVGAGIERKFTDTITGRIEYDYTKYGEEGFSLPTGNEDIDITGHGLKLGVGVQF